MGLDGKEGSRRVGTAVDWLVDLGTALGSGAGIGFSALVAFGMALGLFDGVIGVGFKVLEAGSSKLDWMVEDGSAMF